MWIKETIKNRFLSKKKANKLICLLEFQLNILNDDAYEYLTYSSKLKEYIKDNKSKIHLARIAEQVLKDCTCEDLDEAAFIISNCNGEVLLDDAVECLRYSVSLSHASAELRKVYWLLWEIDSKNLKLIKR